MNRLGMSVYAFSLVVLFLKFFVTITVQARERLRSRNFRYAEDARFWHGQVGPDNELCQRAQNLLRNDAESQPMYMALAGVYLALGAWSPGAPYYFGAYALSRSVHAYFFLTAKQPHRNRAFSVGIALLLTLSLHILFELASFSL